jgi:hypothetical protein
MELRRAGWTLGEIGADLGISHVSVHKIIGAALEALREETLEVTEQWRATELARLEAIHRAHWANALAADKDSSEIVLKCMERRAKLLGLDAPKRLEASGPDGAPIEIQNGGVSGLLALVATLDDVEGE